jgi:hypothetical protein
MKGKADMELCIYKGALHIQACYELNVQRWRPQQGFCPTLLMGLLDHKGGNGNSSESKI